MRGERRASGRVAFLLAIVGAGAAAASTKEYVSLLEEVIALEALCRYELDRPAAAWLLVGQSPIRPRQVGPGGSLRTAFEAEVRQTATTTRSRSSRAARCATLGVRFAELVDWTVAGVLDVEAGAPGPVERHDRDLARRVQILLTRAGFSPGPIDGVAGGRTHRAIAAFLRESGDTAEAPDATRLDAALVRALERAIDEQAAAEKSARVADAGH